VNWAVILCSLEEGYHFGWTYSLLVHSVVSKFLWNLSIHIQNYTKSNLEDNNLTAYHHQNLKTHTINFYITNQTSVHNPRHCYMKLLSFLSLWVTLWVVQTVQQWMLNWFKRELSWPQDTMSPFSWKHWWKPRKTPVRIASVLTDIQTQYLPNKSLEGLIKHTSMDRWPFLLRDQWSVETLTKDVIMFCLIRVLYT
jgi:hypothetical protein